MPRKLAVALAGVLVVAVLAVIVRGGGSGFNYDGRWFGHRDRKPGPNDNPSVVYTLGRIDLKIKDGTFEMAESGMPEKGTVRFDGDRAYLTIKSRFDRRLNRTDEANNAEIELKPQQDGSMLFNDPKGFDPGPIKLTRQPQPKP